MKQRIAPAGAGIVLELQREALESSIAVSDLLRKALLVARKLKLIEQEPWIQSECKRPPESCAASAKP